MVGQTLAQFEIVDRIGQGGMGEVYRARDTRLGREVALKFLPPHLSQDPERVARFEREARTLASISHANIATLHGFEEVDGHRFLIMELVEGEDLAVRIQRGALPVEEAVAIAQQIVQGLEHAHDRGIIHRDLKPANVVVPPTGEVKILDFGLATALAVEQSPDELANSPTITAGMTADGVILGTAAYMSPEQARGQAVDKRADIWAFGCVLYEMLSGQPPFQGDTITDVLAEIVKSEPDWSLLPEETPVGIRMLLWRCLQKDPARRLRDVGDSRHDLEPPDPSLTASVVGFTPPPTEAPAGRRGWVMPALATLVLGLALGFLVARLAQPEPEAPPRVVTRLSIPAESYVPFGLNVWSSLAISSDGRIVVYSAVTNDPEVLGGTSVILVRYLDRAEPEILSGEGNWAGPFFAPGANQVAFYDFNASTLRRTSLEGGSSQVICALPHGFTGGAWAEDGTIVFAVSSLRQGLFQVPATGGEPKLILPVDHAAGEMRFQGTRIDGNLIFGTVAYGSETARESMLFCFDRTTGTRRNLRPGSAVVGLVEGEHLAFTRNNTLYVQRLDREALELVGEPVAADSDVGRDMIVSPNGTLAYVDGSAMDMWDGRVILVSENGSVRNALESHLPYARYPHISPDGSRLAITAGPGGQGTIWVHDLVGQGPPVNLTFEGHCVFPIWSPTGREVAFGRAFMGGGRGNLFLTDADGSALAPRPAIADTLVNIQANCWTEDGRILFTNLTSPDTGHDIWELIVADGTFRPIMQTTFNEGNTCDLSPDGKWLAFTWDRSGQPETWVRRYPDGPPIPVTRGGSHEPVWSRDGKRLFFQTTNALEYVEVTDRGETLEFSAPKEFYRGNFIRHHTMTPRTYDIHPDGSALLIEASLPEKSGNITVVQNWIEEVRGARR